jgi:hypothetical protein
MSSIKLATVLFSLLLVTATALASEADELREKAEAMQREAAELAEHGHKEEATNLKRRAMEMLEQAERLQHHRPDQRKAEIMELRELLEKLRQEEKKISGIAGERERLDDVRREAKQVEMELRELSRQPPHEHDAAPQDEIARRLEHMRIAVDHLHEAGLHDIAEHVAERAEATERELHPHHDGDVMHEVMKQLDEIRHEVGRLRSEVNELRRKR